MKKVWLLIAVMLVLCGCSKQVSTESATETEPTAIEETEKETKKAKTEIKSTEKNTPKTDIKDKKKNIIEVQKRYQELANKNSFKFSVNEEIKYTSQFKAYEFDIVDDSKNTGLVTFYQREDGEIKKGFDVTFFRGFDNRAIKDFITATIMIMEDGIEPEKANDITSELVVSLGNGIYSDIVNVGEYTVYLDADNSRLMFDGTLYLIVLHNSDLNVPINKQDYKKFSYEEMKASLNAGEKAYFTGKVISDEGEGFIRYNHLNVEDENNNKYFVTFGFDDFLNEFEVNETYTFYGKIVVSAFSTGEVACLELNYYE